MLKFVRNLFKTYPRHMSRAERIAMSARRVALSFSVALLVQLFVALMPTVVHAASGTWMAVPLAMGLLVASVAATMAFLVAIALMLWSMFLFAAYASS